MDDILNEKEATMYRNNTIYNIMAAAAMALSLTACVKDELYDTPHPDHGRITVSADWTERGEGVPAPGKWTISIGDYTAEETGITHEVRQLFEPGNYRLTTYNPADGMTVAGTTATISAASSGRGDALISGNPGWLFTAVQDIAIAKDHDHLFTAAMRQQVRQLTLIIEPTGDTADKIESIAGTLSGVASTLDFATATHGNPSDVELDFTKITEGTDADKWKATVRLLGITGDVQQLAATVTFAGGNPKPVNIESDLSEVLARFNTDKTSPLTLGGSMVDAPGEAGITATIDKWEEVDAGNINAQ